MLCIKVKYIFNDGVLIFAGFIIIFMIIQAVIGNSLTILSFIRDKQLRTTYNIYLVNLAVADLMIATISMSIYLTYTLRRNVWLYGYLFKLNIAILVFHGVNSGPMIPTNYCRSIQNKCKNPRECNFTACIFCTLMWVIWCTLLK
jgi:hypothetical protein